MTDFEMEATLAHYKSVIEKNVAKNHTTDRIDNIQIGLNVIVQLLCARYGVVFSEQEIALLADYAIFLYLNIWLEADKNAKQNISSFVMQPYISNSEKKRHRVGEDVLSVDTSKCSRMYRACVAFRDMIALQNEQAKEEGRGYKRAPYINADNETEYSFVDLCFMDYYQQGWLGLLMLYFYRKKGLYTSTLKSGLDVEYGCFNKIIEDIFKTEDDKAFVIKCIQFWKLEYTFRFCFVRKLAMYMMEHSVSEQCKLPVVLNLYYKRYHIEGDFISAITTAPYIHNYDQVIENAFSKLPSFFDETGIVLGRQILHESVAIYNEIYPAQKQDSWMSRDYVRTACFLRNNFNILEYLETMRLKNDNGFSKKIYNGFLQNLYYKHFVESGILDGVRERLKLKAEKRNKDKNKKEK